MAQDKQQETTSGSSSPALRMVPLPATALDAATAAQTTTVKKKETEIMPVGREGLILWTDGGAAPSNPGPAGWGFHGYYFNAITPKKGSGNPDHVLTTVGYVLKADFSKQAVPDITEEAWQRILAGKNKVFEVTPVHYVNGYGAFTTEVSNNVAELLAATRALDYAAEYQVKLVQVLLDSKYVQEGIEQWITGWEKNGWLRRDGGQVANSHEWKNLQAARERLQQRGVRVNFIWVRGHSDHLGNELADHLATVGVHASQRHLRSPESGVSLSQVVNTPADGYWKHEADKHPLIAHRWMYFNTDLAFAKAGEYYIGNEGKDEELLGKRVNQGAYAVVVLSEPDPMLELIRNYQGELAKGTNMIAMAKLDELYQAETNRELMNHGTLAIKHPNVYRLDLVSLSKRPLTRELNPPRLAQRAVDTVGAIYTWMTEALAGDPQYIVTDLTSILYEQTVKTKAVKKGGVPSEPEVTFTLKPEYNVGFASLKVEANYGTQEETKQASVILILGSDLPDRNTLKRLEDRKPSIRLISRMVAEKVFRYATLVVAGEDKAIYSADYSNTRILEA